MAKFKKMIVWKNTENFTGINLAAYTNPQTGNAVIWKDSFGKDNFDGPFLKNKQTLITEETPKGQELLMYIESHPFVKRLGWIEIRDLSAEEEVKNAKIINKTEVLGKYYQMNDSELRETLMMARIDSSGSKQEMITRVQIMADNVHDGIDRLNQGLVEADREYIIVLYKAMDKKYIIHDNNRYRLGNENGELLGYTEENVIHWMKTHEEDYSLLVQRLGYSEPRGTEKKPIPPQFVNRNKNKVEASTSKAPTKPKGGSLANFDIPTP